MTMLNVFLGQGNKTKTVAIIQALLTVAAQLGYLTPEAFINVSTAIAIAFGVTVGDGVAGYPRPK
jgi:hypothetical protein